MQMVHETLRDLSESYSITSLTITVISALSMCVDSVKIEKKNCQMSVKSDTDGLAITCGFCDNKVLVRNF